MDATTINEIETISFGLTRQRLEEILPELQAAVDGDSTFDVKIDGVTNGNGNRRIDISFSNDDMEPEVNPDVDATKLYIDFFTF